MLGSYPYHYDNPEDAYADAKCGPGAGKHVEHAANPTQQYQEKIQTKRGCLNNAYGSSRDGF